MGLVIFPVLVREREHLSPASSFLALTRIIMDEGLDDGVWP